MPYYDIKKAPDVLILNLNLTSVKLGKNSPDQAFNFWSKRDLKNQLCNKMSQSQI